MSDKERIAVVTGAATGIGEAIVRHLAEAGMSVVAVDRDAEACETAARSFARFDGRVRVVRGDIGTPDGAALAVESAVEAFGGLDLLCNNAAVHPMELIEEHDYATWQETFRVNVDGAMLCSKAAIPQMKRGGGGSIVNIGSISGLVPYATGGAYAVSKAALSMLTKVLALEVGPYGITVNCICPGAIRHDMEPGAAGVADPGQIPVGHYGTPVDVAQMVAYLASDAARYVNGAVMTLDGGASAGRVRASGRQKRKSTDVRAAQG